MTSLLALSLCLATTAAPRLFQRHEIDAFPSGYQVAVADLNADGKPDIIALSTDADRVDWYENPTWKRRPIARTAKNIDLAPRDLDGDGRPELALASGFYFNESTRGGQIQWLKPSANLDQPWQIHAIAVDPVVHRLRWGDLDGDGRAELIHAPLFGPGSNGPADPKPAHLWAFRVPARLSEGRWQPWKIDETLTVLHGLYMGDLDQDRRDEILTASFEGLHRFDFDGNDATGSWRKTLLAPGAPPLDQKAGAPRGSSEIAVGHFAPQQPFLAAIEPWHGHQVVVYLPQEQGKAWQRQLLDDTLSEGHVLVVADFDADGADELVAGWRAGGGLRLYDPAKNSGQRFAVSELDRGIAAEGAAVADINADGRPDLVVIAGRTNNLVWYENLAGR